ncbi:hypothetical protein ASE21_14910 [Flavobacterium sp. Root901]|nr:hypothetical protein ASE21_14910 [Flavobacterium sp. Root901]
MFLKLALVLDKNRCFVIIAIPHSSKVERKKIYIKITHKKRFSSWKCFQFYQLRPVKTGAFLLFSNQALKFEILSASF